MDRYRAERVVAEIGTGCGGNYMRGSTAYTVNFGGAIKHTPIENNIDGK